MKKNKQYQRRMFASFLPFDLLARYGAGDSNWNFNGELLRRRNSIVFEDRLFFKALKIFKNSFPEFLNGAKGLIQESMAARTAICEILHKLCCVYRSFDFYRLSGDLGKLNAPAEQLITELMMAAEKDDPQAMKEYISTLSVEENSYSLLKMRRWGMATASMENQVKNCFILLESRKERYALGKIALMCGDLDLAMGEIKKLAKLAIKNSKRIPKILSIWVNHHLIYEDALEQPSLALSLSVIELAKEYLGKDPLSGKRLCEKLHTEFLEADMKFEAAMIGILLGNLEYAKFVRLELYKPQGQWNKGMILTMAIAENDSEFGWETAKLVAKKSKEAGLPPLAAGKLISVLIRNDRYPTKDKMEFAGKVVNSLLKGGGYLCLYYAGQILLECARYSNYWRPVEEIFSLLGWDKGGDITENDLFYWSLLAAYLEVLPESIERKRLRAAIASFGEEARYGTYVSYYLLCDLQHKLPQMRGEYFPRFLRLKKDFLEAKSSSGEIWDRKSFFDGMTFLVPKMQTLSLEETDKFFKAISREKPNKIVKLVATLYSKVLSDREIYEALLNWFKNFSPKGGQNEFSLVLNDAYQCLISGQKKLFIATLNTFAPAGDYSCFRIALEELLLDNLAKKVKAAARDIGLNCRLSVKKISQLIIHFYLMEKEPIYSRELFRQLIGAVLEGRFRNFIGDLGQKNKTGKKIAFHNRQVEAVFREAGIDWDMWHNFSGTETIQVSEYRKSRQMEKWADLEKEFGNLQKKLSPAGQGLSSCARKDIIGLQKQKRNLTVTEADLEDKNLNGAWLKNFFPTYLSGLDYLKRKARRVDDMEAALIFERIRHLLGWWAVKPVDTQKFTVSLWKRDPVHDIFQGNYSQCCVRIGNLEEGGYVHPRVHDLRIPFNEVPAGVMEYLIDKGVQVAEVIDEDSGNTVAQCWLFVSLGGNGEPILVADSFDIAKDYQKHSRYNEAIREAMFKFLKSYAKACGIKKVVYGKKGPGSYTINKYIEAGHLETVRVPPIMKLGGWWNKRKYFLETIGSRTAYLITAP